MNESEATTLERIHAAAEKEFLEHGFQAASLRRIVKEAGVTTGAFYGYYASKAELYEALVGEVYTHMMTKFCEAQDKFASLPPEEQPEQMGDVSGDCLQDMLLYAYQHRNACKLLLTRSEGTRYAGMLDELARIEAMSTHDYLKVLERLGRPSPPIDEHLEHMIITGMFNTYFEMILHDLPLEKAKVYLKEMREFYTAGWAKIMGQ